MVNSMPVSLLYGIKDSANMMDESSLDETSFEELLKIESVSSSFACTNFERTKIKRKSKTDN